MLPIIIRIDDRRTGRIVQNRLFELGCRWKVKGKLSRSMGYMTKVRRLKNTYIFITKSKMMFSDKNKYLKMDPINITNLYTRQFVEKNFNIKEDEKIYTHKKRY